MLTPHYWYYSNPELREHIRKANELRSATMYTALKRTARAISAPFRLVVRAARRSGRRRAARRELLRIDPRLLCDIGISPAEIDRIVHGLSAREPKRHHAERGEARRPIQLSQERPDPAQVAFIAWFAPRGRGHAS